ncbi:MAG: hypothetical protein P4L92_08530 [Rudaea sp.]|nr:hypothetical protein [Rudaea sp.]
MIKRISLQGASDDDVALLRELLGQTATQLHSAWRFHTGADTDLLVIDIDTVYGHMDWLRAHSSGKPVAVLTEHTQFGDADLILHKPLTAANLVEICNRVDHMIPARAESEYTPDAPAPAAAPRPAPAARRPAAVAAAPAPGPMPAPAPIPEPPRDRRLCDWLADAALNSAVRLRAEGAPELVLDPAAKVFHADASLRALAPYCTRVVARTEWQDVAADELAALQAAGKAQPYARLLWLCHALGSHGHLAAGLDINAKYKLSRWPQIEREFPKHFRIATVMLKQPASLTDIAEQSGAPLTDVIDFTNAYNATGYIEIEGVAVAAEPATRDSGRAAILSRLRNPFGGG